VSRLAHEGREGLWQLQGSGTRELTDHGAVPEEHEVGALLVANVAPLVFWRYVEGWARESLVLWAGR